MRQGTDKEKYQTFCETSADLVPTYAIYSVGGPDGKRQSGLVWGSGIHHSQRVFCKVNDRRKGRNAVLRTGPSGVKIEKVCKNTTIQNKDGYYESGINENS